MVDLSNLNADFASEIDRLNKMMANIFAANSIEYNYSRLSKMHFSPSMEFFLEVEGLTASLVISYGRLFSQTTGTTKLKRDLIPEHLRKVHDEIMSLRHERYAHHGAHPSIRSKIRLTLDGDTVFVNPRMKIRFWVGASKEWKPLILWLREFLFDETQRQLEHLTRISGVQWQMVTDDAPTYAVEK